VSFLERIVFKQPIARDRAAFERGSPLHQITPDAPPFCVVHGTHDSLLAIAEAREFAARLRETSRAPVVFVELPGAQHAFELFHSPRTHRVIRGVHRFLGNIYSEHLRSQRKLEEAP
jgi:acetyl esterase/lipase